MRSPRLAAARKFLELIQRLHQRGHQLLRIVPYVRDGPAPFWACDLAPAVATCRDHGGLTPNFVEGRGFFCVRHVPHSPWTGFVEQSLDDATNHFLEVEADLAAKTLGFDDAYVRWYDEMLKATAPMGVVASRVYWEEPPENRMYVFNVKTVEPRFIPLPPPGNA